MKINLEPYDVSVNMDRNCKELVFPKENLLLYRVVNELEFAMEYETLSIVMHFDAMGMATEKIELIFSSEEMRQRFIGNELAWVE